VRDILLISRLAKLITVY